MKSLSTEFRQALFNDEREYLVWADITLDEYELTSDTSIVSGKAYYTRTLNSGVYVYTRVASPTVSNIRSYYQNIVLNLTNSEIWTGGFSYEEAVSEDDSFTALGSAIIGSATLIINNMSEQYSAYDFTNADAVLYVGMEFSNRIEKIKVGTYRVDEAVYNGATIRLTLLDYMEQLDRPYSLSTLVYPASLLTIVNDICSKCGVILATQNFPHRTYEIAEAPDKESTTFREVLSWVTAIAGCFAKFNVNGQLEIKWFNQSALENYIADTDLDGGTFNPWSSGTVYDGGTFNPWSSGTVYDGGTFTETPTVHFLYDLYSQNIAQDDVIITGLSVNVKDESQDAAQDIIKYSVGTSGYVVELDENPFITKSNAQTILNWLGTQLIGLRFRKLNISQADDPAIESGDVAVVVDRKQNVYRILVTRVNFSADGIQTVVCGASTPTRNSATKFSSATKSYVESRKLLKQEKTDRELAEEALRTLINNSAGLYVTEQVVSGATKYYLHNKPTLAASDIQILFSTAGITVTPDSGAHWYGLTVNGDMLINLLSATGISFDWAHGGTLTLGGQNNINGLLRILNASGTEIGRWSNAGINIVKGSIQLGKDSNNNPYTSIDDNGRIDTSKLYATYGSLGDMVLTDSSLRYSSPTIPSSTTANKVYVGKNGISVDGVNENNYARRVEAKNGEISLYQGSTTACRITAGRRTNNWVETNVYLGAPSGGQMQIFTGYHGYHDWYGVEMYWHISNAFVIDVTGSEAYGFEVRNGRKDRTITTPDYAERSFTCYEMPSPMFGDIGDGIIAEDGYCYISLDPVFIETIMSNHYQVFLQKYGSGECYVSERHPTYFVVCGEPGMEFCWEVKAKQADAGIRRLERYSERVEINNAVDYGEDAINHISNIAQEREV